MGGKNEHSGHMATAEQLRLAQVAGDSHDDDRASIQKHIKEIMETTRCTQAQAEIALHDADNNVTAAVNAILESVNLDTWSHFKTKKATKGLKELEIEDGAKRGYKQRRPPLTNASQNRFDKPNKPRESNGDGREDGQAWKEQNGKRTFANRGSTRPRRDVGGPKRDKGHLNDSKDEEDLWKNATQPLVFNRRASPEVKPSELGPAVQEKVAPVAQPCAAGPLSFADVVRKNVKKPVTADPVLNPEVVPASNANIEDFHQNESDVVPLTPVASPRPSEKHTPPPKPRQENPSPLPAAVSANTAAAALPPKSVNQVLTDKLKGDLGLSVSSKKEASVDQALPASGVVVFMSGNMPVGYDCQFGYDGGHTAQQNQFTRNEPSAVSFDNAPQRSYVPTVLNQYVQQPPSVPPVTYPPSQYNRTFPVTTQYNRPVGGQLSYADTYSVNYHDPRITYGAPSSPTKSQILIGAVQQSQLESQAATNVVQPPPGFSAPNVAAAPFVHQRNFSSMFNNPLSFQVPPSYPHMQFPFVLHSNTHSNAHANAQHKPEMNGHQ